MLHCWPQAPVPVIYLRNAHRHVFAIETQISAEHNDRELEFITVQHEIQAHLNSTIYALSTSCEQLAQDIIQFIWGRYGARDIKCQVLEDGENGGIVEVISEEYEYRNKS